MGGRGGGKYVCVINEKGGHCSSFQQKIRKFFKRKFKSPFFVWNSIFSSFATTAWRGRTDPLSFGEHHFFVKSRFLTRC